MMRFETRKWYNVNSSQYGPVYVEKRTPHYVTLSGSFRGRYKVHDHNLFGLGENVVLPYCKGHRLFCFAAKEI